MWICIESYKVYAYYPGLLLTDEDMHRSFMHRLTLRGIKRMPIGTIRGNTSSGLFCLVFMKVEDDVAKQFTTLMIKVHGKHGDYWRPYFEYKKELAEREAEENKEILRELPWFSDTLLLAIGTRPL
ncbi:Uncharacterised protein [uncultured archaeon]|nr:Uncharacterised protein [uncultured archaeon]